MAMTIGDRVTPRKSRRLELSEMLNGHEWRVVQMKRADAYSYRRAVVRDQVTGVELTRPADALTVLRSVFEK